MKYVFNTLAGIAMLVVVGCQQGTSTAPSTAPKNTASNEASNKNNPPRELTVTSPGSQTVQQDRTDEMTVSVKRAHFESPVKIEVRNLPAGVSVDTKELTIPAGKTSLALTIKAAPDAKPVEKQTVTIAATAVDEKDMPEAKVNFDLKVKAKQ